MLLILGFKHREDELKAELFNYLRDHRTSLGGVLQPKLIGFSMHHHNLRDLYLKVLVGLKGKVL